MPSKKIPAPKKGQTLIRMYRQGLGDCFLLTFRGDDGEAVNVLIDCGVWDGDKATVDQMAKVVEDIRAATGNHLNLLACTHEHWDHNSGFNQQRETFKDMRIDNVWLAWTENPRDALARELKAEYDARRNKLAAAINRLSKANPNMGARAAALADVDGVMSAAAATGVKADPADAMKWVRELTRNDPDSFLKPGMVRPIPGAAKSARAFVLGPPHSAAMLRKNLPTKKQQEEGEVYHDHDAFHMRFANRMADDAFFAAIDHSGRPAEQIAALTGEELEQYQLGLPFDVAHQLAPPAARAFGGEGPLADYFRDEHGWRRIDDDWLNTAAQIALWMQSSTNNTSLVLAIELLPARKVLLMAADAQVGNWMSWRDVKFPAPDLAVTADDLLERTVVYKVGHHGSHNATLRRDGLEKMTHDELVAMIPVNRKSVEAKGWAMPYPPMYRALRTATKDRIIRADEGAPHTPPGFKFKTNDVYFEYACNHA
jgi:hypothetical protein